MDSPTDSLSLSSFPMMGSQHGHHDWMANTSGNLISARLSQGISQTHANLSHKARKVTSQQNAKQDQLVAVALNRKVSQSQGLVKTLKEQIQVLKESVSAAHVSHVEIQEAIYAKKAPYELACWRLERRTERPERELKRDNFELALEQEKQTLINAKQRLQQCAEKTSEMVRSLSRSLQELEYDLAAKKQALQIDQDCVNAAKGQRVVTAPLQASKYALTSTDESDFPEAPMFSTLHAQNEDNRQFDTRVRIQKARKSEQKARALKDECTCLMRTIADSCSASQANTQKRMGESIQELKTLRKQLVQALDGTKERANQTAKTLCTTANEITKQDEPFNLAVVRSKLRQQRHPREHIDDPVSNALHNQAAALQKNMTSLVNRHGVESVALERLHVDRAKLEADIQDKAKALYIDMECEKRSVESCPSFQAKSEYKRVVKEKLATLGVTLPPEKFGNETGVGPNTASYGFKGRTAHMGSNYGRRALSAR